MSETNDLTLVPTITALYRGEPREVFVGRTGLLLVRNNKGGVMRVSSARVRLQTAEGKRLSMKQAVEAATEVAPHTRPLAPRKPKAAAPAKAAKTAEIKYIPPTGTVVEGETVELDGFTYAVCEVDGKKYIAVGLPIEHVKAAKPAKTPKAPREPRAPREALPEPTPVEGMTAEVEGKREAVLKGAKAFVYKTEAGKFRRFPEGAKFFQGEEEVAAPEF